MKTNIIDNGTRSAVTQQLINQENTSVMVKYQKFKRSEDLASEIKLIEKKIKACQKKL